MIELLRYLQKCRVLALQQVAPCCNVDDWNPCNLDYSKVTIHATWIKVRLRDKFLDSSL